MSTKMQKIDDWFIEVTTLDEGNHKKEYVLLTQIRFYDAKRLAYKKIKLSKEQIKRIRSRVGILLGILRKINSPNEKVRGDWSDQHDFVRVARTDFIISKRLYIVNKNTKLVCYNFYMDEDLDYNDGYLDASMGGVPRSMMGDYYMGYMAYQDELNDKKNELKDEIDDIDSEMW